MSATSPLEQVKLGFESAVLLSHAYRGDETVVLRPEALPEVASFLRDAPSMQMNLLVDITAVDYLTFGQRPAFGFFSNAGVAVRPSMQIPDQEPWPGLPQARFAVVYHFYSTTHKHRLRLVVPLEESKAEVESVSSLWPAANWLEREVWDMYGIKFLGHPDLRRILMYPEFQGHPLRKDYPVKKRQPLIGPLN